MGKTRNNSLRMQQAVRSIFEDYRQKQGCLGHVYEEAACGCNNALQMWRGPKGEKGDRGPQGPKGDNAGSFLVDAEFVVDPEGQDPGAYLKLVLIDVEQQEQVVYVDLSELEDVYTAGDGIDIHSMVVAARLGAGLTFDNQGNITSAYQFCDGLDETSNVVKVKLDANNNILGFAGSGCKGLTATVNLTQAASGIALVLTGANGTVLNTIPLNGGTGITIQKDAQGFTWLVDPSDLVSSTAGNNLSISSNKLYVGNSTLSYTVGDGVFTLTNASGTTSTVTVPTVVKSLERADMVCEGENAPYLHLTFKRDNGQNLYQDIDMSCLATAELSLDARCDEIVTPSVREPFSYKLTLAVFDGETLIALAFTQDTGDSVTATITTSTDTLLNFSLSAKISSSADGLNSYELENVSLASIIAAGSDGVKFTLANCQDDLSGVNCSMPVWMSCVDNGSNSYTFNFMTGTEASSSTELVLDLVSGDNRVDMKPLLTKIGGKVETKLVPTGDFETATLYDTQTFNPSTPGIVFPAVLFTPYADTFLYDSTSSFPPSETLPFTLDGDSIVCEVPSSYSWYESPAVIVYFSMAPDANIVSADDLLILSNVSSIDGTTQTVTFSFTTVQELLDAGGTLPLNVLMNGALPEVVDDFPVKFYLHVELCEAQDGACYRFTILTGESETKTVLHLEPSCDTDIDLMPAIGDSLTSVSASFSCSGIPTDISSGYAAHIYYMDGYSTIYDEYINNITQAPLVLPIPSGCTSIFVEFYGDLYYSFSIDLSTAHTGEVHCVTGGGVPK